MTASLFSRNHLSASGLILVDKPEGPSSAHVVHRVKTFLGAKKVGHLGTLDPFASGLLLLGVNDGTKIADIFLSASKTYRGVMMLGVTTDSQDGTGNVLEVRAAPDIDETTIKALEREFTGELRQVPPMFSALKRDGVRLYRLARQGKEIPREPRSIRIESLRLKKASNVEIEFEVTCSRGTYVRTLAADMGGFLGCGAHLKALRRTACGRLTLAEAITLDELEHHDPRMPAPLLSLAAALGHLPSVTWEARLLQRLRLGQQELLESIGRPSGDERWVRILDPRGSLTALAEWSREVPVPRWRLFRVFS
jgi:tRNA pseudouridine55 synthase